MSIALVVGLGNPGVTYEDTRHNVGFWLIDQLAKDLGFNWQQDIRRKVVYAKGVLDSSNLLFVKPQAFMNLSGQVLWNLCSYYKIAAQEMVVVYDDINIEFGKVKVSVGGSAGGHNGVGDILSYFSNDFVRFRLGIGQKENREMDLKDHVLGKLTEKEKSVLTFEIPQYINDLKYLILNGPFEAMNIINQKNKKLNEHDESTA